MTLNANQLIPGDLRSDAALESAENALAERQADAGAGQIGIAALIRPPEPLEHAGHFLWLQSGVGIGHAHAAGTFGNASVNLNAPALR